MTRGRTPGGPLRRATALFTTKRLTVWGLGLLAVSWFIYVHTMATPGLTDRIDRFKGADYVQFYVMGSFVLEGRTDALYDASAHLAEARRRIDPGLGLYAPHPNYGPQVALAFAPLALLPFAWSLGVFLLLTAVCYAASVWIVWRECGSLRTYGRVVAIAAAASPLFFAVLRYGQTSAFTLLMCAAVFAALRHDRRVAAGIALGCLAYKPQLAMLVLLALLVSRDWRTVGAAAAAVAAQLAVALAVGGPGPLADYFRTLWWLARHPDAIVFFATEVHSARGFFHLLVASPTVVTICSAAALAVLAAAAVRCWRSAAPISLRWSAVAVMTILASPHLLTYDLLLLTVPMLLCADWAVAHREHALQPGIALVLLLLYFTPFSGSCCAIPAGVQVSVPVMAVLAWRLTTLCVRPSAAGAEARDGGAEVRGAVVPELLDPRVAI